MYNSPQSRDAGVCVCEILRGCCPGQRWHRRRTFTARGEMKRCILAFVSKGFETIATRVSGYHGDSHGLHSPHRRDGAGIHPAVSLTPSTRSGGTHTNWIQSVSLCTSHSLLCLSSGISRVYGCREFSPWHGSLWQSLKTINTLSYRCLYRA